jgi:uncharacterized protein with HEPN domain
MPRDETTLLDIARSARLALDFMRGLDLASLRADLRAQSAVLHQLLILGEAVKRLSLEFREAHQAVPWSLIAGMRDKLIHEYDEVDLREVWHTVNRDIPERLKHIEPLLAKLDS